jgi:tRNA1Val (adenine37-N6)-methyltransferase
MDLFPGDDETLDRFFNGRIRIIQKKAGYRFSVDAPLLADFILSRPEDEGLELGTGSGIISLLLSIKPFRHITALEIQASLYSMALRNVRLNGCQDRITVLHQDLATYHPARTFDLVFANPPYFARGTGPLSASLEKSIAKHELKCDIFVIMRKTAELLDRAGRACFIYPAAGRDRFHAAVKECGLRIRRERAVRPRANRPANLFLTEIGFVPGPAPTDPPLVLFRDSGDYSEEAMEIFSGRNHVAASE